MARGWAGFSEEELRRLKQAKGNGTWRQRFNLWAYGGEGAGKGVLGRGGEGAVVGGGVEGTGGRRAGARAGGPSPGPGIFFERRNFRVPIRGFGFDFFR